MGRLKISQKNERPASLSHVLLREIPSGRIVDVPERKPDRYGCVV